ncbi:MAG: ABC transporter ATP-binding protein, partial [Bacilli bacterium]|nr:ABC transporter ATP-binding protein [Bacilli bacterium]
MLKLLKELKGRERIFIVLAIILIVLQVILDLKVPDYMSEITKLVQTSNSGIEEILENGFFMILCSLGSLVLAFSVIFLASFTGTSFEKNLRKKVFRKVQSFGMEEINKFSTSSLITRATNDITQIKMFVVMGVQMLAKAPIMATLAIIKIAGKEWSFSLITLGGVVIVIVLNLFVILVAIPKFKKIQKLTDNINGITSENLHGIKVIRAYNAEEYQLNKFTGANEELTNTNMFVQKIMAFISPVMSSIMAFQGWAIYFVGAILISNTTGLNRLNIFSDMVVFSAYSVQVILSFMVLAIIFVIYPRTAVSIKRISEVLDTDTKIKEGNITKSNNSIKGEVEFKNVSFKYPDAEDYVLKDISFKANTGETIAVIGSTGSGKSTLINLIPRLYDTSSGEILIDGINIKDMSNEYLYSKLGYISQKAVLFKGTILENIRFGKDNKKVAKENVEKALDIAQASSFIRKLDKGIKANLAQSGTNISGVQKQII